MLELEEISKGTQKYIKNQRSRCHITYGKAMHIKRGTLHLKKIEEVLCRPPSPLNSSVAQYTHVSRRVNAPRGVQPYVREYTATITRSLEMNILPKISVKSVKKNDVLDACIRNDAYNNTYLPAARAHKIRVIYARLSFRRGAGNWIKK